MVTLLIDQASIVRLNQVHVSTSHGDKRTYFVACAPWLAVLVLRNGLSLEDVARRVVNAQFDTLTAPPILARPGNADKPHTIVTVHSVSKDLADVSLVLAIEQLRDDGVAPDPWLDGLLKSA